MCTVASVETFQQCVSAGRVASFFLQVLFFILFGGKEYCLLAAEWLCYMSTRSPHMLI